MVKLLDGFRFRDSVWFTPMSEAVAKPPSETSPMLEAWGDLAPRIVRLARERPALWRTLSLAPSRAVHAVGIWLMLSDGAAAEDAFAASEIERSHPRQLLSQAFPDAPARMYRLLDLAGPTLRQPAFYSRLAAHLGGQWASEIHAAETIDDHLLDTCDLLARVDPLTQACRPALGGTRRMECLDALVTFLRAHGAIAPDEGPPTFPKNAGIRAVHRTAMTWLDRAQAPDPGFIPPSGFRLVRTVAELRDIGQQLKNCIGQRLFAGHYLVELATGEQCYLAAEDPVLTLVALRRHGRGLWSIEQVDGADFCSTQNRLELGLRAAGVTLLRSRPDVALSAITDYRDTDEEDGEELGDEDLAA